MHRSDGLFRLLGFDHDGSCRPSVQFSLSHRDKESEERAGNPAVVLYLAVVFAYSSPGCTYYRGAIAKHNTLLLSNKLAFLYCIRSFVGWLTHVAVDVACHHSACNSVVVRSFFVSLVVISCIKKTC